MASSDMEKMVEQAAERAAEKVCAKLKANAFSELATKAEMDQQFDKVDKRFDSLENHFDRLADDYKKTDGHLEHIIERLDNR